MVVLILRQSARAFPSSAPSPFAETSTVCALRNVSQRGTKQRAAAHQSHIFSIFNKYNSSDWKISIVKQFGFCVDAWRWNTQSSWRDEFVCETPAFSDEAHGGIVSRHDFPSDESRIHFVVSPSVITLEIWEQFKVSKESSESFCFGQDSGEGLVDGIEHILLTFCWL